MTATDTAARAAATDGGAAGRGRPAHRRRGPRRALRRVLRRLPRPEVAVIDRCPSPAARSPRCTPRSMIHDVAGFPAVKGRDLVDELVEQAAQFEPTYLLGRRPSA